MSESLDDHKSPPSTWRRVRSFLEGAVLGVVFGIWAGIAILCGGICLGQLLNTIFG